MNIPPQSMTNEKAYEILGIDLNEEITIDIIKRHYKLSALKYHPDKNKNVDAVAKFQNICEAYEYLCKYNNIHANIKDNNYETLLFSFLKKIIGVDSNQYNMFIIIIMITR